jgi:hypothetical protein
MTNRTEVLLKDLTPDMIRVQSDHAKEIMPPGAGERDPAGLSLDQICYLKLATAEQLHALRRVFPAALAWVEWPEAVNKNRERMRRALRRPRLGPLSLIPENARRFIFEIAAVQSLFAVAGIADGGGKYYRSLSSCVVLALCPLSSGKGGEVVKEPPEEWFPVVQTAAQLTTLCDCPDCEARNRP